MVTVALLSAAGKLVTVTVRFAGVDCLSATAVSHVGAAAAPAITGGALPTASTLTVKGTLVVPSDDAIGMVCGEGNPPPAPMVKFMAVVVREICGVCVTCAVTGAVMEMQGVLAAHVSVTEPV